MFRLLGPLEVVIDGRPAPLGRNRQRTVLALLAANVNQVVSVDRLVEALWHGRPPSTATQQVQTCVWRLRAMMRSAGAGEVRIERADGGYVLRAPRSAVDVFAFESLMAEAKAAAAGGDAETAVGHYRRAAALFRGPVLAEVDSPVVQAMAARWEERGLTANEERFALALAGGAARELIDELSALVDQHPLRERLRSQLMLALHRDGRQAEALAVYRTGRDALVEAFGVEPGPLLREACGVVLGRSEGPPKGHRPRPVPLQLPADVVDFVGRDDLVDELTHVLLGGDDAVTPRIALLAGRCGVGKTALAVRVAHRLGDQFPDGQLFARLGASTDAPARLGDVLTNWLHLLGVPAADMPADVRQRGGLFRRLVEKRRMLVVLDDAGQTADVRELIPGGASAVVVTSRACLADLPGGRVVEVQPLSDQEAEALFVGIVGKTRALREPGAVQAITHAGGRLPLTLRACAARVAARPGLPLGHFVRKLRDSRRALAELSYGELDIRPRLAPTVRALPRAEMRVWLRTGLLRVPDFPVWAAVAADVNLAQAETLLERLVDRRLLEVSRVDEAGSVRYRFDPVIGLYARECALTGLDPEVCERTAAPHRDPVLSGAGCPRA